jgi:hypothetical protein
MYLGPREVSKRNIHVADDNNWLLFLSHVLGNTTESQRWLQYWPKVTKAKKRTSHSGCNACNSAFDISFATQISRIWSAHHVYNICVGCALLTRLSRVCRPFMYRRCRALLERRKCRKCAGPWVSLGQYCTSFIIWTNVPPTRTDRIRFECNCRVFIKKWKWNVDLDLYQWP